MYIMKTLLPYIIICCIFIGITMIIISELHLINHSESCEIKRYYIKNCEIYETSHVSKNYLNIYYKGKYYYGNHEQIKSLIKSLKIDE